VKDAGPTRLDLVAIVDADRALVRSGIHAREQALATWMEAAAWAGRRGESGRVLVHTARAGHQAIQALVRWEPIPFLLSEADRRREAGFAPGDPVFRLLGIAALGDRLVQAGALHVLTAPTEEGTVCLVSVAAEHLSRFLVELLRLAGEGAVHRVEAEPQI